MRGSRWQMADELASLWWWLLVISRFCPRSFSCFTWYLPWVVVGGTGRCDAALQNDTNMNTEWLCNLPVIMHELYAAFWCTAITVLTMPTLPWGLESDYGFFRGWCMSASGARPSVQLQRGWPSGCRLKTVGPFCSTPFPQARILLFHCLARPSSL